MRNITFFILITIIVASFNSPLLAQGTITDQLHLSLTSVADGSSDYLYLNFASGYSESYQGVEDGLKWTTYYAASPAIWSRIESSNTNLFVNGLPMIDNRTVRIGFSVPQAGDYVFALLVLKKTDLRSIVLIDKVTNDTTDLLKTYYRFTSARDSVNINRFSVLINAVPPTPLPESLSVIVADNMLIGDSMRSDGPVYVTGAGKIDVDNTSANPTLMTDTIILYSNNTSDGLLRNLNTNATGGVKGIGTNQPKKVILRKHFDEGVYTYFSLPFPVASANVKTSTGTALTGGTNYWAYEFDAQRTSDTIDLRAWKELAYANGFRKGVGYLVWYENATTPGGAAVGGDVDFPAGSAADIDTLFSGTYNKTITFPVYFNTTGQFVNPYVGDGWAFLGGLNSTTFTIKGGNIGGYTGTVWYRNATDSRATETGTTEFQSVSLIGSPSDTINLPPYTPFYVQEASGTSGIFTFKPGGLSIESAQYRSSTDDNPTKDQLYFILSSDIDHSFDRFYLNFADDYVETYRGVEDALKMTTFYAKSPAIWSIQDQTNTPLFVNGLPMKDGREVKIGFSVPDAGDYTISLDPLREQEVRNVILADNVTRKKVDLLQTSYSFNSETINGNNNRFVLYINSSYTGIPSTISDEPYAYTKDNLLTVKNLSEGNAVQVLDLTGRMIASGKVSGKEFSATLIQKGVYLVTVKGEKTSVLKVLNK